MSRKTQAFSSPSFLAEWRITAWVTRPAAIITMKVVTTVIVMYWIHTGFRICQESSRPTAAGTKRRGMISMRKSLVSLMSLTLMIPVPRHISISIMPYMLAGTGSGSSSLSISPVNDIMSIIPNCLMYFKLTPSFLLCFLQLTSRRKLVLPIYYGRFFLVWQEALLK